MSKTTPAENPATQASTQTRKTKPNGQAPNRVISDPKEVAQLVMMRIDHVNSKKDELTIAVKALADTAKQLVSVYANQQAQIAKLAKRVEELEKAKG
jgi:hypothetical protein